MIKFKCLFCLIVYLFSLASSCLAGPEMDVWVACESVMENAKSNAPFTTIILSDPEEEKYTRKMRFDANNEHPYMLSSWLMSSTVAPSSYEWNNSAGYSRCIQAISEMANLSQGLQQYTPYTPINLQTLNSLLDSTNGTFQLYGFNTAYTYAVLENEQKWELCPFVILDSSNQIFEGNMYLYMRKIEPVDDAADEITEYLISEPETTYMLLHHLINSNENIDEADMNNIKAWLEMFERVNQ